MHGGRRCPWLWERIVTQHLHSCTHKTKERKLPLAFFDQASTQAARTPQMYSTVHHEALLSLMLMMHSRWPKGANTQEKLSN
jgi:hypothetical protein